MILIRLKEPGDKRARICGSRCYNAKGSRCVCVCGGMNHSKGLQVAAKNVADATRELMKLSGTELHPSLSL